MHISLREQWRLNARFVARSSAEAPTYLQKLSQQQAQSPPSLFITLPKPLKFLPSPAPSLFTDQETWFAKSSAQVATLVAPQVVRPESCELKLDHEPSGRPHPLGVRFSRPELVCVKEKARTAGCSTNEYIRASTLGSNYKPHRDPELIKALQALNLELTRQGNNINQIAKHLNGGTASPAEADGMLGIVARSHIQTHRAVRTALSEGKEPQP